LLKRAKDDTARTGAKGVCEKLESGASVASYSDDELRTLILVFNELRLPASDASDVEESIPPIVTGEEIFEDVLVVQ
jgi:hypothetical protein